MIITDRKNIRNRREKKGKMVRKNWKIIKVIIKDIRERKQGQKRNEKESENKDNTKK